MSAKRTRPAPVIAGWACRAFLLCLPFAFACDGDKLKPDPAAATNDLYWALRLNHRAVTLSTTPPYDTSTVTATPENVSGEPLAGLPAPTYTSSNPDLVTVSPEGVLTALAPTGDPVAVIAELTANNLKHVDTVMVLAVDDPAPPVLTTFSIHPVPPDSAKFAYGGESYIGGFYVLERELLRATDASGNPLTDFLVDFRVSDTTIAALNHDGFARTLLIPDLRFGMITIYASTTLFGVTKEDTLQFRIGLPLAEPVPIQPVASGSSQVRIIQPSLTVGVGAAINWFTTADTPETDITFTDPTNVSALSSGNYSAPYLNFYCNFFTQFHPDFDCHDSGNFVLRAGLANGALAMRVFSVPGTYEYHSTLRGVSGRIVVVDER